jgi:hypothetical protein
MVRHLQKLWQKERKKSQKKEGPEYPGEGAAKTSAAGPFFYDCQNLLPWGYKWLKVLKIGINKQI